MKHRRASYDEVNFDLKRLIGPHLYVWQRTTFRRMVEVTRMRHSVEINVVPVAIVILLAAKIEKSLPWVSRPPSHSLNSLSIPPPAHSFWSLPVPPCDRFTQSPETTLLFLVAHTERVLALLDQARLLMAILAPADRALLLLLFARTKGDHVALAAAAPMVGASGGLLRVVRGSIDVLRKARIRCAVVGDDIALACDS